MAKKQVTPSTLTIATAGVEEFSGEILEQTGAGVKVRVKKPRSSKFQDRFVPANRLVAVYGSVGEEGTVVEMQHQTEYDSVTGAHDGINEFGMHQLTTDEGQVVQIGQAYANSGAQDTDEEGGGGKKAAPAKKAAAKGKAKAEPEEEEEEEEFEPEEGSYVKITDEEENVVKGTVTAITAKTITIEDKDEEEHKFKRADVTIEEAKAPAKAKGKAKAEPEEEEEEEEEDDKKSKGKGKGGKKADADDDWE